MSVLQQVGAAIDEQAKAAVQDLRQMLGEALSDQGYQITDGEGPIDFTDSRDVDTLLDRLMPIIQAACIVNAEVVTNTAMFQRSIELHEKIAKRDVHFWSRYGKNGVRSIERPVVFDPKDLVAMFRTVRFSADCINTVMKDGNHGIAHGDLERAGIQLRALHALGGYT
jgi:hypothetical protein